MAPRRPGCRAGSGRPSVTGVLVRALYDGSAGDRSSSDAVGVRPADAYPTTDVGYLACRPPAENGMVVNEDLLVVEIVDDDDRPVPEGDVGHHVLVSSLHQRTLPLIRYRIDDRIRLGPPRAVPAGAGDRRPI